MESFEHVPMCPLVKDKTFNCIILNYSTWGSLLSRLGPVVKECANAFGVADDMKKGHSDAASVHQRFYRRGTVWDHQAIDHQTPTVLPRKDAQAMYAGT